MRKLTNEEHQEIERTIETAKPVRNMSGTELALYMAACDRLMRKLWLKQQKQLTNRGGKKQGKRRKTI